MLLIDHQTRALTLASFIFLGCHAENKNTTLPPIQPTIHAAEPHWSYVDAAAISGDAEAAVTVSKDSLRVWSLPQKSMRCALPLPDGAYSGQELPRYAEHPSDVLALVLNEEGSRAVVGLRDGTLKRYDLKACALLKESKAHQGEIVALSSSGELWASGGKDGKLLLWKGFQAEAPYATIEVGGPVLCIDIDPKGEKVAVGYRVDEFGSESIYDTNGKKLLALPHPSNEATSPTDAVLFTPDGGKLVSLRGFQEQTLELWDLTAAAKEKELPIEADLLKEHHGALVGFSDASTLLALDFEGAVLFDISAGKEIKRIKMQPKVLETTKAKSMEWSAARAGDDWLVLVGNQDGSVALFSLKSGEELFHVDRRDAKKISKEQCASMVDAVIALSKTAKGSPYWELPSPARFQELASAGKTRDALLESCVQNVSEPEYRCTISKKSYDDLDECDYFRMICDVEACGTDEGGR